MRRDDRDSVSYGEGGRGGIPPEAMEVIADVFLASAGRDDDQPAYSEEQLGRKRRRSAHAEVWFGTAHADRYVLGAPNSDDIPECAGLPGNERAAWDMYSQGYKVSEIARLLRVTRPTAVRLLRSAARRISACDAALRGLSDVYRCEVRRRVYRKPMHCPDQPCRRLGYCRYALQHESGS